MTLDVVWDECDCIVPLFHEVLDDWLATDWIGTDGMATDWLVTDWTEDEWV